MAETERNLYASYLARVSGNTFKSSENEDEAWVDTNYILKKLPQPTIGNRELMKFEVEIECDGWLDDNNAKLNFDRQSFYSLWLLLASLLVYF